MHFNKESKHKSKYFIKPKPKKKEKPRKFPEVFLMVESSIGSAWDRNPTTQVTIQPELLTPSLIITVRSRLSA